MALTRQTNGSSPTNIMQASWWNDYMDLLTGVMSDQPVNVNNTILGNNFTADYSNTMGYWIQDSFGIAQRCMHVHTDGDLHLIPSPANNKMRITKNSYAYDLAIFDASGANGATTLNGTLTLTGGTAAFTCTTATITTLNVTTLNASSYVPASVTCTGAVQGASLVSNVFSDLVGNSHLSITTGSGAVTRLQDPTKISFQIPGGTEQASILSGVFTVNGNIGLTSQLNFTGGNNGGIRNPTGGALEMSAGGSASVNFFTGNFASSIGSLNNAGLLAIKTIQLATGSMGRVTFFSGTVTSAGVTQTFSHGLGGGATPVMVILTPTGGLGGIAVTGGGGGTVNTIPTYSNTTVGSSTIGVESNLSGNFIAMCIA